ncbi:MAG: putative transrane protein [Proteobacteria bacterium]|nr:putative transrane protein [Pseudomonadota bacterium]
MQGSLGFPLAPKPFDGNSRRVEAGAAFNWLRQGWALFLARPLLWLAATIAVLLFAIACLLLPQPGWALFFLLLPALMVGTLLFCRELAEGRKAGLADYLAGFRIRAGGLALIGLLLALFLLAAWWCGRALVGDAAAGLSARLFSALATLLLALPVWLAAAFAPALYFLNDMPPLEAMKASFNACAQNWLALLVFSVLFLLLALVTTFSAGLGFFLLIPVMSGAHYAAYRDFFPGT